MITEGRMLDAARKRICPGCGHPNMIPGPRGGASQNFYCEMCGDGWNLHGVDYGLMGVEPIGKTDPKTFVLWKSVRDKMQRK